MLMCVTIRGTQSVDTIFGFSASLLSVLRGSTLHMHLVSNVYMFSCEHPCYAFVKKTLLVIPFFFSAIPAKLYGS